MDVLHHTTLPHPALDIGRGSSLGVCQEALRRELTASHEHLRELSIGVRSVIGKSPEKKVPVMH